MEGTPPPTGASPTQPYKCGQNVKIKVNVNTNVFISAQANVVLANAEINTLILTLNILTAFIRLGRARPEGAGCPPYLLFYLKLND